MADKAATLPMFTDKPKPSGPVECLGLTFENDDARRAYFLDKLREKLRDHEFRKIEGFPIGSDEDILALSDPPYYTACPNPFLQDFIEHYCRPYDPNVLYSKEPFAADVSEGKNDPIYMAHSYHTKVPHRAIMRYILHYTEPGDLVLDGFCGTGMAGVAAQQSADRTVVQSLGYTVQDNGTILNEQGQPFSKLGARYAVLNDLAPAATFIANNYNVPVDIAAFEQEAKHIMAEVEVECGWMYETRHKSGRKGIINYTVWSDVLICPECQKDFVYWDATVDYERNIVHDEYSCPHCGSSLSRRDTRRKLETVTDHELGRIIQRPLQVPVLINYSTDAGRYEKRPDQDDLALIEKVERSTTPYLVPTELMCFKGTNWGDLFRGYHEGTTNVHHFYTKRNRWILGAILARIEKVSGRLQKFLKAWFTSSHSRLTRLNRYMPSHGRHVGPLSGTYYLSSLPTEISPFYFARLKLEEFAAIGGALSYSSAISTQSSSTLNFSPNTVDYIFTDPPFGDNLPYSELNFLWEAWLRVFTNNQEEAIVSQSQRKGVVEYQAIMQECFHRYYEALKPGRWITVEFHNSRNAIWNSIQEALGNAGFVVADVRTLDKQKGTTKQLAYTSGAVKQDLVISAYKPNGGLEDRFKLEAGSQEGAWDFARTHLRQLPVFVGKDGGLDAVPERMNYLLFDRMVAFHVQRGVSVPLSAAEFYAGLKERFGERDEMYFLPEQAAEYDKKRLSAKEVLQLELFVTDESSSIQWLKQRLAKKPQTFQELHPQFTREITSWQKHERLLDLRDLLEQNFLSYNGQGDVPPQIHAYLSSNFKDLRNLAKDYLALRAKAKDRWYVPDPNKAADLEKLRERALLREFEEYRASTQRKLKVFRLEAMRAGFKKAWQERDYKTIIAVAQKVPEDVLQEDPKLLMWYDQASLRAGHEG